MKENKKYLIGILVLLLVVISLAGCTFSQASKVNHNISLQASEFKCIRKITVYNAISDNIIFSIEGAMDISNNTNDELVVTCKVGENVYKKNYIYLNKFTLYAVEDITGTVADPYHYKVYYHYGYPVDVDFMR